VILQKVEFGRIGAIHVPQVGLTMYVCFESAKKFVSVKTRFPFSKGVVCLPTRVRINSFLYG
jgi:hypothetical protein